MEGKLKLEDEKAVLEKIEQAKAEIRAMIDDFVKVEFEGKRGYAFGSLMNGINRIIDQMKHNIGVILEVPNPGKNPAS